MKRFSLGFILFLIATSITSGQSAEIISVTWSTDFKTGDVFEWEVKKFLDSDEIPSFQVYNVTQGSLIQIELMQNLSQIVIPAEDYPDNLPEVSDLAKITIDDATAEFFLFDAVFFIIPIDVKLTTGSTNAFFGAIVEPDFGLINTNGTLSQDVYIERLRNETHFEEFIWEVETGLLHSATYHSQNLEIQLQRIVDDIEKTDDSSEGLLLLDEKIFFGLIVFLGVTRRWINKEFRRTAS